jgi:hypothetical protein
MTFFKVRTIFIVFPLLISPMLLIIFEEIVFNFDTLCAIVGGFNARSSDFHDFIIPDDDLWSFFNYNTDDAISAELYDFQKLISYDIPLHRKSNNKGRCNAYDNKLLNMCKNNNMYIVNGETKSRSIVEAHIGPGQYGPRYGNDLVVIQ